VRVSDLDSLPINGNGLSTTMWKQLSPSAILWFSLDSDQTEQSLLIRMGNFLAGHIGWRALLR
jgi:hypothetical protein